MACDWLINERNNVVRDMLGYLNQITLPHNPCIVFDIDHTLLDQFGHPIEPVVYLYNDVKRRGITPVIITAREGRPEVVNWTTSQLKNVGIVDYKLLYFLHPGRKDPWRYKLMSRKNVSDRGYSVIMTVGDEQWDHGDYGGVGFIIPKCFCNTSKIDMEYFR